MTYRVNKIACNNITSSLKPPRILTKRTETLKSCIRKIRDELPEPKRGPEVKELEFEFLPFSFAKNTFNKYSSNVPGKKLEQMSPQYITFRLQSLMETQPTYLNFAHSKPTKKISKSKLKIKRKSRASITPSRSSFLRKDEINRTMRSDRRYSMKTANRNLHTVKVPLNQQIQQMRDITVSNTLSTRDLSLSKNRFQNPNERNQIGAKIKPNQLEKIILDDLMEIRKRSPIDIRLEFKSKGKGKSKSLRKLPSYSVSPSKPIKYKASKGSKSADDVIVAEAKTNKRPAVEKFCSLTEMVRNKMLPAKRIKFHINKDLTNYTTVDRSDGVRHPEFKLDNLLAIQTLVEPKPTLNYVNPKLPVKFHPKYIDAIKKTTIKNPTRVELNFAPRRNVKKNY